MSSRIITLGIGLFILTTAANLALADSRLLLNQYHHFSKVTKPIDKRLALRIQSHEQDRRLRMNVYGFVNYPYSQVADVLARPAVMCDFLILNMNVKTCTFTPGERRANMVIYVAGKKYAPLYRSMKIEPYFELQERSNNYIRVLMASPKRRWGATEYSVMLEASPYKNRTLVHLTSAYKASHLNKAATSTYLKLFARKKVGFTVVGRNQSGQPEYVRGIQGVIERNAVRSYLALQAYLETASVLSNRRFESRLRRWFELTDVYSHQLHEMDWRSYLSNKQREYQNQLRQQQRLSIRTSKHWTPQEISAGG